jgi:hypothetical protein
VWITRPGAVALVLVVAVAGGGCASAPPPPPAARAKTPDLVWVCAQHDLLTDLRGRITFQDVQRTLCEAGRREERLDFAALAASALAEARRCGGEQRAIVRASPDRPPSTIRELYDALAAASAGGPSSPGCTEAAMIDGLVRALGAGYTFNPLNERRSPDVGETPSSSLVNKTIVYVRFPALLAGGRGAVEAALRAARGEHTITGLMLDLRGADGAPVDELARFVDLFLDDGVALQWRARSTGRVETIGATRRPPAETLPLIVLVDEKTRSGAEGVAGTLRARGRALLIGRRTAGQGFVRSVEDLPSGSRLAIPTGDLIEPGVGVISGRGVSPDVELGPLPVPPASADGDAPVRLGAQVLAATRSAAWADLLEAARRVAATRAAQR